jgi:polar amino acid transport system substrate-binding protein
MHRTRRTAAMLVYTAFSCLALLACGGSASPSSGSTCGGQTVNGIAIPSQSESQSISEICQAGKLKAGSVVGFPEVVQDPKSGEWLGSAVDVARIATDLMHVKLEIVPTGYDTFIAGMQSDKFVMTAAALFATPARKQVVDFVEYSSAGTCYATKDASIKTVDDINNPNVSLLTYTGTGSEEVMLKKFTKSKIVSVVMPAAGQLSGITQLEAGRVTVASFDSPTAKVLASKYPDVKIIPSNAENCIKNPDLSTPIAVAYRKGDSKFGDFLTAIVNKNKQRLLDDDVKYADPKFFQ